MSLLTCNTDGNQCRCNSQRLVVIARVGNLALIGRIVFAVDHIHGHGEGQERPTDPPPSTLSSGSGTEFL